MALKVAIQQSKEVALWKEYKDSDGNVLAEFKIRGSDYKAYRVAVERAQNQLSSKGFDVATASNEDKLYHELLLEAAACHLVADWKGVVFVEDGKEIEPECTPENATKLFNMGGSWRHTPFRKCIHCPDLHTECSWRHTPFRKSAKNWKI